MSLILSGTDGLSDVDGSAATPAIRGTDANTGIFFPAADTIAFAEGGVEVARFNSSGQLGVGTATVATNFRAQFLGTAGSNTSAASSGTTQSASAVLRLQAGGGFTGTLDIGQGGGTGSWLQSTDTSNLATTYPLLLNPVGGAVCIGTTSSLGARLAIYGTAGGTDSNIQITNPGYGTACIGLTGTSSNFKIYNSYSGGTLSTGAGIDIDTSGNLLVGDTAAFGSSRLNIKSSGTSNATYNSAFRNSASTALFTMRDDGYITTGTAAVSPYNATIGSAANLHVFSTDGGLYRSTSSIKYKRDVVDYTKGLDAVAALRPVFYKGTNPIEGDTVYAGLIAEEVHEAGLTEFVQYNQEHEPEGLSYGNMMALAFKAIQEQQALILSLTARITALETP